MPVQFPQYADMAQDPRGVLVDFVATTRNFLDEIVRTGTDYEGRPLFDDLLRELMRAAWAEARSQFEVVMPRILQISSPLIEQHGLSGQQLKFKLATIERRNTIFTQRGGGFLFHRVLGAIDTLLKSILDAAGAGGAIEEIKEYIGHSTND